MKQNINKGVRVLFYILLLLVLFVAYVRYLEKSSVFYPEKNVYATPQQAGLPYEDVYFRTEDGFLLHGWLVKTGQDASTVLYFHGNAGNIADRIEKIALLVDLGLNVFIIDYRGYGLSDGKPSEKGLYKDAIAAYEHLAGRRDIDPRKIIVYGTSLGAVAAIDLAAKRSVSGLVIDSAFTSAKDMAKIIYPFIPSFLIGLDMDNAAKIKSVTVPKLFLHSREDEVVPFSLAERLYQTAPSPKELLPLPGMHNNGYLTKEYLSGLKGFLQKYNLL